MGGVGGNIAGHTSTKLFMGGDFNGQIGDRVDGNVRTHGGFGFRERNSRGVALLDFVVAFDLTIVNSLFKMRVEHIVTFKSGSCTTQIEYFHIRVNHKRLCKDCKVIHSECLGAQHRLLMMELMDQEF